jgi:hypothetical protein
MTPREQKAAHARASDKNVERRPHRALQQLATRCALPRQLDPELRADDARAAHAGSCAPTGVPAP